MIMITVASLWLASVIRLSEWRMRRVHCFLFVCLYKGLILFVVEITVVYLFWTFRRPYCCQTYVWGIVRIRVLPSERLCVPFICLTWDKARFICLKLSLQWTFYFVLFMKTPHLRLKWTFYFVLFMCLIWAKNERPYQFSFSNCLHFELKWMFPFSILF